MSRDKEKSPAPVIDEESLVSSSADTSQETAGDLLDESLSQEQQKQKNIEAILEQFGDVVIEYSKNRKGAVSEAFQLCPPLFAMAQGMTPEIFEMTVVNVFKPKEEIINEEDEVNALLGDDQEEREKSTKLVTDNEDPPKEKEDREEKSADHKTEKDSKLAKALNLEDKPIETVVAHKSNIQEKPDQVSIEKKGILEKSSKTISSQTDKPKATQVRKLQEEKITETPQKPQSSKLEKTKGIVLSSPQTSKSSEKRPDSPALAKPKKKAVSKEGLISQSVGIKEKEKKQQSNKEKPKPVARVLDKISETTHTLHTLEKTTLSKPKEDSIESAPFLELQPEKKLGVDEEVALSPVVDFKSASEPTVKIEMPTAEIAQDIVVPIVEVCEETIAEIPTKIDTPSSFVEMAEKKPEEMINPVSMSQVETETIVETTYQENLKTIAHFHEVIAQEQPPLETGLLRLKEVIEEIGETQGIDGQESPKIILKKKVAHIYADFVLLQQEMSEQIAKKDAEKLVSEIVELLRELGYKSPEKILVQFMQQYDLRALVELLAFAVKDSNYENPHSVLPKVQAFVSTTQSISQIGKYVLSIFHKTSGVATASISS